MRVLVLGGAGHTGRFVVADLLRRGFEVVAAGRDRGVGSLEIAGAVVPYEPLSLPDPTRLDGLLESADVVIHCAGPFADTALDVARTAAAAGVDYVDVSAEQAVTRELLDAFRDAPPATRVVPSASFFGGLGDLVATAAAADWTSVDRVDLVLGMDSWQPTEGTRRTVTRNRGRHVTFRDGVLAPPQGEPASLTWDLGDVLGTQRLTETSTADQVTLAEHLATDAVRVFLNDRPVQDLTDPSTPPPVVTGRGRSDQYFSLTAVVTLGDEQRRLGITGHDIYAVTAPMVGQTVEALGARDGGGGALPLGALVDAPDFLRRLAPAVTVVTPT